MSRRYYLSQKLRLKTVAARRSANWLRWVRSKLEYCWLQAAERMQLQSLRLIRASVQPNSVAIGKGQHSQSQCKCLRRRVQYRAPRY
jgi:hypothetical protein